MVRDRRDRQVVGRLAATVATILRGKHKPQFTPHQDTGDFVIIINAEKVKFTGKKLEQKTYQSVLALPRRAEDHAGVGHDGKAPRTHHHLRRSSAWCRARRLGRQQMDKLKIYKGPQHPHQAQQPKEFKM